MSMEEFSVLMKITHVTHSPYLFDGRIKAGHHVPWERWNSQRLDCIHPCHVFEVCMFRTQDICLVDLHLFGEFSLGNYFHTIFFAWRMSCCQVLSKSISALSQKGVFSLLSVIGCRTKSYDSNKNWGCHWHPACHLCWPKTPGASSESSRGRGAPWSWCF